MMVFGERKPEYPGRNFSEPTLLLHTTNTEQILLFLNHSSVVLTKLSLRITKLRMASQAKLGKERTL